MRLFRLVSTELPTELRQFLEDLATTEGRLAVSAAIVFLTLLCVVVLVPYILRRVNVFIADRLLSDTSRGVLDVLTAYIPTTFGVLAIRVIQIALLVSALIAMLIVWGLVDVALGVVRFAGVSAPLFGQIGITFLVLFFTYVALDLFGDAIRQYSQGADRITEHQQEIALRLGHVTILVFGFGALLTLWGVDLSGLLVGAGFLGIVVGFAARQTLGSIIAGFVLMFSRPFTIGDWIEIGGDEGIVTDITIVNTHMRNFDGESIVMPNDIVSNKPITNRSKQGHLRLRIDVGVDYSTDTEHAQDVALQTLDDIDIVSDSPPPDVVPTGFDDSAVILELRVWIDRPTPPRKWRATRAVVHNVKAAFESEGIKIPFPQRELSGRAETEGFRIRGEAPPGTDEIGASQRTAGTAQQTGNTAQDADGTESTVDE
jgi:small-conductance mechanosensitive channel